MTLTERAWNPNGSVPVDQKNGHSRLTIQEGIQHSLHGFVDDDASGLSARPSLMRRYQRKKTSYTALIVGLMLLLVIASGLIGAVLLSQRSSATSSAR